MKILRSTEVTLKCATQRKQDQLKRFLSEYLRVVNKFIDYFWGQEAKLANKDLTKNILSICGETWLSERAKQCAARQALAKCKGARTSFKTWKETEATNKTTPKKPRLTKSTAMLSSQCAVIEQATKAKKFDAWLYLSCLGNKLNLRLPVKLHTHYYKLLKEGNQCSSVELTENSVKIIFEIETEKKQEPAGAIGLDTNMGALAGLSTGELLGTELKEKIQRVKRCRHGSKGQKRARTSLKQYIDLVCKQIMLIQGLTCLVIENLKGITKGTKNPKRRLGKDMRRSIGIWNVRYFHNRLEQQCEWNRVSFRTVPAYFTSQTCSCCDSKNTIRRETLFKCKDCGYLDHADLNAPKVILDRFLKGKYSAGYHSLPDRRNADDMKILQEGLLRQQNNGPTSRKPCKVRRRRSSTGAVRKNVIVPVAKSRFAIKS